MQTPEVKQNTDKFVNWFCDKFEAGQLDNESILEFIKVAGAYCNLATFAGYGRRHKLTYPGVVDRVNSGKVQVLEMFGVKFIVDNE